MKTINGTGQEETGHKRAYRTPQSIPVRKCKICGTEFKPVCAIQLTCSRVCSLENKRILNAQWKLDNPERYQERKDKAKKRHKYIPSGKCRICGELIKQGYASPVHRSTAHFHDECVFRDCMDTINQGRKLNTVQIQRLAARGFTMREFINEYIQVV